MSDAEAITAEVVKAMHGAGPRDDRKPRFDGTINLGHVLTILTMASVMATMWANNRVDLANHDSRIKALEAASVEMKNALTKIADTEQQTTMNQYKISLALEQIAKKP